ncbi:MAG: hypothetical protein IKO91_02970 [Oscillospiraceae bacterium]|nr:hypothetical protein [Oscillospiraceae bacterium]
MLRVRELSLSPERDRSEQLKRLAAEALGVPTREIQELSVVRRSIDARRQNRVRLLYTVDVRLAEEEAVLKSAGKNVFPAPEEHFSLPIPRRAPDCRPVVAGFGPAGMFIALALAEAGLRPLVLERGSRVEARREKVRRFRENGVLDPECNVQFGEGGAGTFSDGKLNSGIGGRETGYILRRFVEFGAQERVRWDAAPHVGTDVLTKVVRNLRERILSLGGEVRFDTCLTDLITDSASLRGIVVNEGAEREELPCTDLFLAIGHSARDTMEMLLRRGLMLEPKPFSMGVRIEHLQREIDRSLYGRWAGHTALGAAPYKLSLHLPEGTGVYTFCMCPGGYVMAAASEEGGVVTNGMSYSGRAGENANSALLVSLHPSQFPEKDPLGGLRWQRELEKTAFHYGGGSYAAPVQLLGDFLDRQPSPGAGRIQPTYTPGVRWGDMEQVLPEVVTDPLRRALPLLDRKLRGFGIRDAVLTAPETRSSSPVRILRDEKRNALGIRGLYPCGEGAGWAGGIISAAADGLKSAAAYLESLR